MVGFFKSNKSAKNISEATQIGYSVLEKIRLQDFDQISDGDTTLMNMDPQYECSWNVIPDSIIDMKTINLTVKWLSGTLTGPGGEPDRRQHQIELSTICAR
jgi:hypothetical protein